MTESFVKALRDAGNTRVTAEHVVTDHVWSDRRIALEDAVLACLRQFSSEGALCAWHRLKGGRVADNGSVKSDCGSCVTMKRALPIGLDGASGGLACLRGLTEVREIRIEVPLECDFPGAYVGA